MVRIIFVILLAVTVAIGISSLSYAMMCHGQAGEQQTAQQEHSEHKDARPEAVTEATPKESANVGNKICPVSGEKIDEKLKATYEYEGKIYNFCCPMCIEEFKKDPQKYIKKVEEELKASQQQESGESEKESPMTEESGHMHEKDAQ